MKTLYILIGLKGSGKTFIGKLFIGRLACLSITGRPAAGR